jgi:hypothetical protein
MIGGSMVTGVAPMETRNEPKPTFRIMICSYRSAAMDLIYSEMLRIAPVRSIIVTWSIVKRTIREIPNDARTPLTEAYRATAGDVLKNMTATSIVMSHPITAMRVPDCFMKTIPTKIMIIGNIARKNRKVGFNSMPALLLISYNIT